MDLVEKRTISKVMWRLMPFLVGCYFVAYLDRSFYYVFTSSL